MSLFAKRIAWIIATLSIAFAPVAAQANHSWNGYHWARTSSPFTLKIGDNVTAAWDSYLNTSISDWSQSSVLDLTKVAGTATNKNCRPTAGRVEVCNAKYGNNGWLGIASVWVSGSHITQGTVKMNDTYYNTAKYNTPAWRNLVMCQEIGHTLGLDHQDEVFNNTNLGTCMDYTDNPSSNQHPNQHDFDMLAQIYAHLDTTTTVGQTTSAQGKGAGANLEDPSSWGKIHREDAKGRPSVFENDHGNSNKVFTFVVWTEEAQPDVHD